jgi:hypothetical protein
MEFLGIGFGIGDDDARGPRLGLVTRIVPRSQGQQRGEERKTGSELVRNEIDRRVPIIKKAGVVVQ